MEPLLITKNQSSIKKANLKKLGHLEYLKLFYSALSEYGITVTLKELVNLVNYQHNNLDGAKRYLFNFIQNQLLEKAGTPSFNGVPISKEKLKELIQMPDLSVFDPIFEMHWHQIENGFGIIEECFKVQEDTIELSDNSESIIENMYTYYTKNDAGVYILQKINEVCDSLTKYDLAIHFTRLASGHSFTAGQEIGGFMDGVDFNSNLNKFQPNLLYIRNWEQQHPDFVLEP